MERMVLNAYAKTMAHAASRMRLHTISETTDMGRIKNGKLKIENYGGDGIAFRNNGEYQRLRVEALLATEARRELVAEREICIQNGQEHTLTHAGSVREVKLRVVVVKDDGTLSAIVCIDETETYLAVVATRRTTLLECDATRPCLHTLDTNAAA